ncbi:hypothetical protein [Amycolatopsis taiwanensis]|uniref:PRD domain-containing protein n=1 Tax=Amycolatopsis taiwanensis TaxID=342230 RepID=A0A9W6VH31_9PSEU|nr:hypothetical protein [Amycolatopsis taiwanensis]GLY66111.1 hypothetical protein Atai01_27300 [Amycolatopsis taiwanensis]
MRAVTDILDELARATAVSDEERAELDKLMNSVLRRWPAQVPPERELAVAAHCLTVVRRVRSGERLAALDPSVTNQLDADSLARARATLREYAGEDAAADEPEAVLLALHYALARSP